MSSDAQSLQSASESFAVAPDTPAAHEPESKGAVIAAVAANIGVAIVKFIASAISGSSAMFSEAIHSLVDSGNGILLLIGMRKAQRKPDFSHPFGYGQEVYFYTMIVALAIFFVGGGLAIMEGLETLEHALAGAQEIGDPLVGYIVLGLAIIIEGASLRVALKTFNRARGSMKPFAFIKQAKDPSVFTVVLEDSAAELGLLFALVGTILTQVTRNAVFDAAASILIGLLLCAVAATLLVETKSLLVGEGLNPDQVSRMRDLVEKNPAVLECGRILSVYMGPSSLVVCTDVTFAPGLDAITVERATDAIEASIKQHFPETQQVFIEIESLRECLRQQQQQQAWEE